MLTGAVEASIATSAGAPASASASISTRQQGRASAGVFRYGVFPPSSLPLLTYLLLGPTAGIGTSESPCGRGGPYMSRGSYSP